MAFSHTSVRPLQTLATLPRAYTLSLLEFWEIVRTCMATEKETIDGCEKKEEGVNEEDWEDEEVREEEAAVEGKGEDVDEDEGVNKIDGEESEKKSEISKKRSREQSKGENGELPGSERKMVEIFITPKASASYAKKSGEGVAVNVYVTFRRYHFTDGNYTDAKSRCIGEEVKRRIALAGQSLAHGSHIASSRAGSSSPLLSTNYASSRHLQEHVRPQLEGEPAEMVSRMEAWMEARLQEDGEKIRREMEARLLEDGEKMRRKMEAHFDAVMNSFICGTQPPPPPPPGSS